MFNKAIKQNIAIGVATAAILVGMVATPSHAGNSTYCSGTWVCVYKDAYFGTGLGWRNANFALQNISTSNQNQVSSWENKTGTNARWYTQQNGTGTCNTMGRYSELGFMDPFTQNDRMISWAGNAGC